MKISSCKNLERDISKSQLKVSARVSKKRFGWTARRKTPLNLAGPAARLCSGQITQIRFMARRAEIPSRPQVQARKKTTLALEHE
ncbi:hypothetical protein [Allofranklinella schreckenbergeri]|uniref:hypothetical protein n=1 Tax=Allofranklinella schreckenbergeri TaxID=1076744 RepID=UPI0011C47044|nr:hypothetical protein [Allofranklinella schreckenbergeri]